MLHFVLGRIKSGKTSYMMDRIREKNGERAFFVVPEQHSHSIERLFCERCGNPVSSYAEVTSFGRLSTRVKAEVGGLAAQITGGAERMLIAYSAIGEVAPALSFLAKGARSPEKLSEILSALDEFKAYGVTPEELSEVSEKVSASLSGKLSDLAFIYAAYEKKLGEERFDAYDELRFAADAMKKSRFFKGYDVYFDGFSGFTAIQLDVVRTAIRDARDVFISLDLPCADYIGTENGIFDEALDTYKKVSRIAEEDGVPVSDTVLKCDEAGTMKKLSRALFADEPVRYEDGGDEVVITSSESAFSECELAAAYILDKVREGARFRDFSVAVSSHEYINLCEMVFSRFGIPTYISDPKSPLSKPVVALISVALKCASRGIRSELVMEYIKTGFSGISSRGLETFENYIYTWSPKPFEWASKKEFLKNPFGISAEEDDESRALLETVNRVKKKVCKPLENLSEAIKKSQTGRESAEAIYDFINEINLPRRVNAYAYLLRASERFSEASEYENLINMIYSAIDGIGRIETEKKLSAEEVSSLFEAVISQFELATIPATLDCVTVSEVSRADGGRCKYRIVLGANEGLFPKTGEGRGLLCENDRRELSSLGMELSKGIYENIAMEYRRVHDVLCSAEKGLYVSSLAAKANGEEMYEAAAVSALRAAFGKVRGWISPHEARLRAKVPCFDESVAGRECFSLWENDPEFSEKLSGIEENSKGTRGPIMSTENIEAIFGKKIYLSASRADCFSSCRYQYFLRYGLYAYPREKAQISPIEAGNLMHHVLEIVLKELSSQNDYSEERAVELSKKTCREYIKEKLAGAGELSGRMKFLLTRIEDTVCSAVLDVVREILAGSFRPVEFELDFSQKGDLPPLVISGEKAEVSFSGKVDRVDMYDDGEKLYFRVVDYKSGAKTFSLDECVNGIGMQMLLYMFALEEMGEERYGKVPSGAGVMYIPVSRNYSDTRGVAPKGKRREGVVLDDVDVIEAMESGEEKVYIPVSFNKNGSISSGSVVLSSNEFQRIKERMRKLLAQIGDELASGMIEPNPYSDGQTTSCRWCKYKSICAFDEERGSDAFRELREVGFRDIISEGGGESECSQMDR